MLSKEYAEVALGIACGFENTPPANIWCNLSQFPPLLKNPVSPPTSSSTRTISSGNARPFPLLLRNEMPVSCISIPLSLNDISCRIGGSFCGSLGESMTLAATCFGWVFQNTACRGAVDDDRLGNGDGTTCVRLPFVRICTGTVIPCPGGYPGMGKSHRTGTIHFAVDSRMSNESLARWRRLGVALIVEANVSRALSPDPPKPGSCGPPSSPSSTSPTAESARRIQPAFLSKTTKRLR